MTALSKRIKRAQEQAKMAEAWKRIERISTCIVVAEMRADLKR